MMCYKSCSINDRDITQFSYSMYLVFTDRSMDSFMFYRCFVSTNFIALIFKKINHLIILYFHNRLLLKVMWMR